MKDQRKTHMSGNAPPSRTAFVLLLCLALILSLAGCAFLPVAPIPAPDQSRSSSADEQTGREETDNTTERDPEAEKVSELLRMTVTHVSKQADGEQTTIQIAEFDEKGLVTKLIIRNGEEEQQVDVSYSWNEHGDPSSFSVPSTDDPISGVIENHYEGSKLVEAVISDLLLNGNSLQNSSALDKPSSPLLMMIASIMQVMQRYVGYRDCTLRTAGTENKICLEQGRIVYSNLDYVDIIQETSTEYGTDGSVCVTQNIYLRQNSTKTLQSSVVTLTDAAHFQREMSVSNADGKSIRMSYRFEDGTDPETGAKQRTAYLDQISYSKDTATGDMKEIEQQIEQMRSIPLTRYILDDAGRVVRQEQTEEYQQLQGGQRTILWYDSTGRITKQMTLIQNGTQSAITTTTEYTYRS